VRTFRDRFSLSVAAAYAAFVMVGVSGGVSGVLLPAQMSDYGVDRATIGITFFVFSAGFFLAGSNAGMLIHRLGTRNTLAVGVLTFAVADFITADRPAFIAFVLVQAPLGYGFGMIESVLNTYLTHLPQPTRRINRLHAFFGVGALLGPAFAAWMLRRLHWTSVPLVLGLLALALLVMVLLIFPKPEVSVTESTGAGSFGETVRERAVMFGALFLAVYVGLEVGVGTWGFSFLVDGRGQSPLLAGYALSGYWLGLTAGRFLINPAASSAGVAEGATTYACLVGVLAAGGLAWLASAPAVVDSGLVLLGFFLGPIFPTTMAITPSLTAQRLVPSAIGVINGFSVTGGSLFPWLAGVIAQSEGISTLLPVSMALGVALLFIGVPIARRIAGPSEIPVEQ
jgi:fucose permease